MLKKYFLLLVLLCGFFQLSNIAQEITGKYHYYYFDEKINLEPSANKFVVKFKDKQVDKENLLSSRGLSIQKEFNDERISDLFVVESDVQKKTISDLIQSDDIEYTMPVFLSDNGKEQIVTTQFVAKFEDGVTEAEINQLNQKYGVTIVKNLSRTLLPNRYLLEIDYSGDMNVFDVANIYHENSLVQYATPDFVIVNAFNSITPNDTYYPYQWGLTKIDASYAWEITQGSSDVVVAVLDNGVQLDHPDLVNKLVDGYDCYSGDSDPSPSGSTDGYEHGTACAGIIAAETNNSQCVAGLAWNCKIMPLRIGAYDSYPATAGTDAFLWAIDPDDDGNTSDGADVISNSWGGGSANSDLTTAINTAVNTGRGGLGCVVVFSSGNDNYSVVSYPASLTNVIAVGATDQNDSRSLWVAGQGSNYGSALDVVAPGTAIYTTDLTYGGATVNNYYDNFNGTSAACPFVAGLAALVISQNPTFTYSQVQDRIIGSVDDLGPAGWDEEYGWGRINALIALTATPTTSGTLASSEGWSGTVTLTGNVFVPSGKKLLLSSSATINLGSSSIISTGGTIINKGATINGLRATLSDISNISSIAAYCGRIQKAFDYADYDSGNRYIVLESGNFEENVSSIGTGKNGVAIVGSENYKQFGSLSLYNYNSLIANSFGANEIHLDNCNLVYLYSATVDNIDNGLSKTGLSVNGSEQIWMTQYAGMFAGYCGVYAATSEVDIDNSYIQLNEYGIRAFNEAYVTVDTCLMCNNDVDLFAYNFSTIRAKYCMYTNGTPVISKSSGCTVSSTSNRDCGSVSSNIVSADKTNTIENADEDLQELADINSKYSDLSQSVNLKSVSVGLENNSTQNMLDFSSDYMNLVEDYKTFIEGHPESSLSKSALASIVRCYGRIEGSSNYSGLKDYLLTIINSSKFSELKQSAERMMVKYYMETQEFDLALQKADELLEKYADDEDYVTDLIYQKGLILAYENKETDQAAACFSAILSGYPENYMVPFAENQLEILGYDKDEITASLSEIVLSDEITLGCYPNPFNPATTITFTLPQKDNVKLVVYDVLGREVMKLANGAYEAGEHKFRFNASDLASGVYIYSLQTSGKALSKKMMLLK